MAHSYHVSVVDSLSGMVEIAKLWRDLLAESRSSSVFLTWEWLYSWVECFLRTDQRLFVLLVYKDSELIGIAPWSICRRSLFGLSMRTIEFLGVPDAGSDYLDIFSKRGREKEVAHQIYEFLLSSKSLWDSLVLEDISSQSLFLLHFTNRIEEAGKYIGLRYGPYCPSVLLPHSVEAFRSRLSSNRRQQFARHLRRLEAVGRVVHHTYDSWDASRALKNFFKIYEQRWGDSDKLFQFLQRFISRSEANNWVQVDILSVGGRDIAGLLHFRYDRSLAMYLMAVDHSFVKNISVGNILVGFSIEKAITGTFSRYDFLRGTEDYKFHWANEGKREVCLYYYSKKAVPLLWLAGKSARAIAKVLLR